MPAVISTRIRDGKGNTSTCTHNIPLTTPVLTAIAAGAALGELIDAMIGGKVESVTIGYQVDLSAVTIKATPQAGSDVEEGARFGWLTTLSHRASNRIATFLESKLFSGTKQVNTLDTQVAAYLDAILNGITTPSGDVDFVDSRDEDIESNESARENFGADRG